MWETLKTMEQRWTVSPNCGLTTTTSRRLRSRRQIAERQLTRSARATSEMMRLAYRQAFHSSTASKATAASCQVPVRELATLVLDCNWSAAAPACNLREHDPLCSLMGNAEVAPVALAPEGAPASLQYPQTYSRHRTRKTQNLRRRVFCTPGSELGSVGRSR